MRIDKQRVSKVIRTICVRSVINALFYSGAINVIRRSRHGKASNDQKVRKFRVPFMVLLYHRVNPYNDPYFPATSVKAFDAQIRYLTANYQVTPLAEIIRKIKQGDEIASGTIAITFDDGYRDNYVYAHPILKKYNCPATLFAATSYIGTKKLMWNDQLAFAVKFTKQKTFHFPNSRDSWSLGSLAERVSVLRQILETLKTFPERDKRALAAEIQKQLCKEQTKNEPLMLSWAELKQMAHENWEVGSHTHSHVILTKVPLPRAVEEIRSSSAILERHLGRRVRLFAYPNGKPGDYNSLIKTFLRDSGYLGALTTVDQANGEDVDLFEIGRKSTWEEMTPYFALNLARSYRHQA